jgi:hypothetical protein
MNKPMCILAVAIALAAGGCATPGAADQRHGYVGKVYAVGERPSDLPACLAALTGEQLAGGRFVELKYGAVKLRKHTTALAPAGLRLAEHDKVEFGPASCADGEAPRIRRVVAG